MYYNCDGALPAATGWSTIRLTDAALYGVTRRAAVPSIPAAARVSLVPGGIVVIARPPILLVVPRAADADRETPRAVQINTLRVHRCGSSKRHRANKAKRKESFCYGPHDIVLSCIFVRCF